jgi:hypothetical protein
MLLKIAIIERPAILASEYVLFGFLSGREPQQHAGEFADLSLTLSGLAFRVAFVAALPSAFNPKCFAKTGTSYAVVLRRAEPRAQIRANLTID